MRTPVAVSSSLAFDARSLKPSPVRLKGITLLLKTLDDFRFALCQILVFQLSHIRWRRVHPGCLGNELAKAQCVATAGETDVVDGARQAAIDGDRFSIVPLNLKSRSTAAAKSCRDDEIGRINACAKDYLVIAANICKDDISRVGVYLIRVAATSTTNCLVAGSRNEQGVAGAPL